MANQIWIFSTNEHFATENLGRYVSPEIFNRLKKEKKVYSNNDESIHWFATSIQPKHKYSHIKITN